MDEKKPLKEEKYNVIYWPAPMLEQKQTAYDLLLEIDCNWSRLLQSLLGSVIHICKYILSQDLNFRHYKWELLIQHRKTGECHSSLPAGTYKFNKLRTKKKRSKK